MKRITHLAISLTLATACAKQAQEVPASEKLGTAAKDQAAQERQGSLPIGSELTSAEAPLLTVDGQSTTIASHKGEKGTLVIFTCNHCPYVKAWRERIVAAANALVEKGVGVVAINSNDPAAFADDTPEVMKTEIEKHGMKYAYVVDPTSDVARAYGATKTPELFLFDGAGKLVFKGAFDDNSSDAAAVTEHYLTDATNALLANKPIAKPESKALGCSIKFRDAS